MAAPNPPAEDSRELLRETATLLLAAGVSIWVLRMGSSLGSFAGFCALGLPAALFLRTGLAAPPAGRGPRPWQAVSAVVGLALTILASRELVDWIGSPGDAGRGINVFWTFGLVAALAWFAGERRGIRFGLLFAALAATVSFTGLCQAVLSDGIEANYGAFRVLLVAWALLLAGWAVGLARGAGLGSAHGAPPRPVESATSPGGNPALWRASELLTAAGLAAVVAGGLGLLSAIEVVRLELGLASARSSVGWELVLLVSSIALVVVGARLGTRGPAWVGALGVVLFGVLVGLDVAGDPPQRGEFGVWPWILLASGAIGLLAASVPESSRPRLPGRRRESRAEGAGPQEGRPPPPGDDDESR